MSHSDITYHLTPTKTTVQLPRGTTDCHCHVFGPQAIYPYAEDTKFRPGDAPKEKLFELHDMMGIERCVVVQSGCHGYNNSVTADTLAVRPGRYLGIALLPTEVSDNELSKLHNQGFRGVRFNYMAHLQGGASVSELQRFAERLDKKNWHIQIHMDSSLIVGMAPALASLPVTVVVDHMGRVDASQGINHPSFVALQELLKNDNIWVKVSGSERCSRQDAPYGDALPFARKLVENFSDRVVWGTDWPHPNFRAAPPDDGVLVNLLTEIAPTEALLKALLVDNPMKLYNFDQ